MTVREAQERIDSIEFDDWRLYDQLQPIGGRAVELLLSELAAMYLNAHLPADHAAVQPEEFTPWTKPPADEAQPAQDMAAMQKQLLSLVV